MKPGGAGSPYATSPAAGTDVAPHPRRRRSWRPLGDDLRHPASRRRARRRRWHLPWGTVVFALVAFVGVLLLMYPTVASWWTQYNQSRLIVSVETDLGATTRSTRSEALSEAHSYNAALVGGALIEAGARVPTGSGAHAPGFVYDDLLRASADGVMARLRIPAIDVDLPIYHGTSDAILDKGVGHLEGTSLPVGGADQHSVLTAHRGLAGATLFDDLDQVVVGDTFTLEVFGEVLTYRVRDTRVVLPEETEALLPQAGEDLVTLVTCTPLGINTHRILVTGERVTPTPQADVDAAGQVPDIPGFPWWAVVIPASFGALCVLVYAAGRPPSTRRVNRPDRRA
ncbi:MULTISPECIES: class C sortase [Microbacterium]|uniref:class C sortase n=1 Tax=Microbacterium TaxID=33882 RepID=UPI001F4D2E7D|nr:class C sortase [Microbacterium testaceum]